MTPVAVGVDVGGTKVLAVSIGGEGAVLAECRVPTPAGEQEVLDAIAEAVSGLGAEGGGSPVGVGVGMPGLVDRRGVIHFAPNLPGVVGLDVVQGLRRRLERIGVGSSAVLVVDNDANCAGFAEKTFGAGRGVDEVVFVTLGTGIGGAIVTSGSLLGGANNFAAEIGHMTVEAMGPRCVCGKRGCWEFYASGTALGRLARDAALAGRSPGLVALAGGRPEDIRGEHVVQGVAEGDPGALATFEEYGFWVAVGLANLAALLDPELFILAGGVVGPARPCWGRRGERSRSSSRVQSSAL